MLSGYCSMTEHITSLSNALLYTPLLLFPTTSRLAAVQPHPNHMHSLIQIVALRLVRVHALLEIDAKLFPNSLQLLHILLILALVLNLGLDACGWC